MNRVVTAGIAALGFLCAFLAAAPARAQEDQDKILKYDKAAAGGLSTLTGTITAEDLTGCSVTVAKGAAIQVRWKDIKSIDYAGSPEYKRAKGYADAGSLAEARTALEDLRKKTDLRAILKPHVLDLLGGSPQPRTEDFHEPYCDVGLAAQQRQDALGRQGCDQGERGQIEVVGDADAGIISQHRDEMRRPDSIPDRGTRNRDPDQACPRLRRECAMKDIDRDDAGNETNQTGEQNQPPVMLSGKTGKNTEHDIRPSYSL